MPRLKKHTFHARNSAGHIERLEVEFHVDTSGRFYSNLPEHLRAPLASGHAGGALIDLRARRAPEGFFRVSANTLEELEHAIGAALEAYIAPEVTEEPVIRYNIESHASFAEDADGNICPNAGWPGAKWADDGSTIDQNGRERAREYGKRYGGHHTANPAEGGYGLVIGAKAMVKRTMRFGERETVEYLPYREGDPADDPENDPAALLNSWTAMSLGDSPSEIPYSDEAALFFHSLLLGMAELSRRIQSQTFGTERLLALIASHSTGNLLLPRETATPTPRARAQQEAE